MGGVVGLEDAKRAVVSPIIRQYSAPDKGMFKMVHTMSSAS